MVLVANLIHILCLIALVCFADSLYKIYTIIFITGLAYSSRANVSYLYGSEFLAKDQKLKYGVVCFIVLGLL